jgi:hypothetical protein
MISRVIIHFLKPLGIVKKEQRYVVFVIKMLIPYYIETFEKRSILPAQ